MVRRWLALLGAIACLALGHVPRADAWGGSPSKLKLDQFKGENVIVLIIDQMGTRPYLGASFIS